MMVDSPLNYDYSASKQYCKNIGLVWLGDDFVREADTEAFQLNFTQEQVNAAMKHHLWQVKWLFDPTHYSYFQRILLAFYFLTGRKPK